MRNPIEFLSVYVARDDKCIMHFRKRFCIGDHYKRSRGGAFAYVNEQRLMIEIRIFEHVSSPSCSIPPVFRRRRRRTARYSFSKKRDTVSSTLVGNVY